jgi:4-diphosphocytidyl-2-C-methyl-D-erythritol kinase
MICFPNAKINIGLYITEKRPDGYHNIETLFYPTKLCDVLEIIEASDSTLPFQWSTSGIPIDGTADENLCIKALNLLKKDYSIPPVKIHLHKVIPFGAGLGGGSADGAFTLTTLNKMFNLNIDRDQLISYASQLGADCAFFIHNNPCTATGIGDILKPFEINLKGYFLMLIKPEIHISTSEAYRGIKPQKQETSIEEKLTKPINLWESILINEFEGSVFPNNPKIKEIKDELYNEGAVYASMTGSGAAVFGLFKEKPVLNFPDCFTWIEAI